MTLLVEVISSRFLECKFEISVFVEDISEQSSASRSKEQLPSPSGTNLWLQSTTNVDIFLNLCVFLHE